MDKDSIGLKKRLSFIEQRKLAWKKVMKNHPEGVIKDNLQQIKNEMKKEEANKHKEED